MAVTWTVTPERTSIEGKNRRIRATLSAGASSQTVTSGGDAIPVFGNWGFKRNLDLVIISEMNATDGYVYKYDKSAGKILVYLGDNNNAADGPLIQATGADISNAILIVEAVGW